MTGTIRRVIFEDKVRVCPHCGSDREPLRSCGVVFDTYTCEACHADIRAFSWVPCGSPRDPQWWRGPDALEAVRAVFPGVQAIQPEFYPGFLWPPDHPFGIVSVLGSPGPVRVKVQLENEAPVISAPSDEEDEYLIRSVFKP